MRIRHLTFDDSCKGIDARRLVSGWICSCWPGPLTSLSGFTMSSSVNLALWSLTILERMTFMGPGETLFRLECEALAQQCLLLIMSSWTGYDFCPFMWDLTDSDIWMILLCDPQSLYNMSVISVRYNLYIFSLCGLSMQLLSTEAQLASPQLGLAVQARLINDLVSTSGLPINSLPPDAALMLQVWITLLRQNQYLFSMISRIGWRTNRIEFCGSMFTYTLPVQINSAHSDKLDANEWTDYHRASTVLYSCLVSCQYAAALLKVCLNRQVF